MLKNNKSLKKIVIVLGLISLILVICAVTSQKQIGLNEYSEDIKILMENNKGVKILNTFLTDKLEVEEGYMITIDNIDMILLLVNELPLQAQLEDFINGQSRIKDAIYKNVDNKYIFIFDKNNPKALKVLDNLTL